MKSKATLLVAMAATLLSAETTGLNENFDNPSSSYSAPPDFLVESNRDHDPNHGNVLRITRSTKTHKYIRLEIQPQPPPLHNFTVSLDYLGIGYFFVLDHDNRQLGGISLNGNGQLKILAEEQNSWHSTTISTPPGKWVGIKLEFDAGKGYYRAMLHTDDGKNLQSEWFPMASTGTAAKIQLGNSYPIGNVAFVDNVKVSISDLLSLSGRTDVAPAATVSRRNIVTATSEDDSRDNLDTLSGESGEYQFDFPAPVELSTITLTGGETISAEVVGINSGGQSVEIAAGKDFVVVGNTRQADFSPATLNRVMVTFKGQPGAKLPRISLWQHQTTTQRDADSHLASVLKGDFRLPVYESDENAGLHLFNTGEKPLKLSITVKERKSGRLIFPTSYKTIPAGETKIEFPLADLPDGEYLVSIVNTDDGATMLRLLRRQLIPETLQPDILEMTGKKLLFPDAHCLHSVTGINFHPGIAQAVPVSEQKSKDDEVMRHGGTLGIQDNKLLLSFYTLDGTFSLASKRNYLATTELDAPGDWEITPLPAKFKMPPTSEPPVTIKRYNVAQAKPDNTGSHQYRFYDPETDGMVNPAELEMKYIRFQKPSTLGYTPPIECDGFRLPQRTIWPIWHKEPGLSLVLSRKPFLSDGYPGGLEEGFETNDNFVGSWLSEDEKSFFFAHGRVLRRYEPFNVPYDNLSRISRIITVFRTTDGINFDRAYMALPDIGEPAGTQHYGATVFKINESGAGLICALVLRYFAAEQRFCLDIAYSWDGFKWKRFPGEPLFLDNTPPGTWMAGNTHPSDITILDNNRIFWLLNWQSSMYHFYGEFSYDKRSSVTGEMIKKRFAGRGLENWPLFKHFNHDYDLLAADIRNSRITPALMILRPDGFFYAEAGDETGKMVTLPIMASGEIHVNANVRESGFLRLYLLDAEGKRIPESETTLPPGNYYNLKLDTKLPASRFQIAIEMKDTRLYSIGFLPETPLEDTCK